MSDLRERVAMSNNDCFIVVDGRVYVSLDDVKDAMRGARNIILEDAAEVASGESVHPGYTTNERMVAHRIATAIRALKESRDG